MKTWMFYLFRSHHLILVKLFDFLIKQNNTYFLLISIYLFLSYLALHICFIYMFTIFFLLQILSINF